MNHKIKQQLVAWAKVPLNWFGRIVVIKMNALPHFSFTFLTMNLYMPKAVIK